MYLSLYKSWYVHQITFTTWVTTTIIAGTHALAGWYCVALALKWPGSCSLHFVTGVDGLSTSPYSSVLGTFSLQLILKAFHSSWVYALSSLFSINWVEHHVSLPYTRTLSTVVIEQPDFQAPGDVWLTDAPHPVDCIQCQCLPYKPCFYIYCAHCLNSR